MNPFPLFLKLEGRSCLVIGAGRIADGKAEGLLRSGATVTVIAPEANDSIRSLAQQNKITWHQREVQPGDTHGFFLVIAGTNIAAVNRAVADEARAANILVNAVDDPPYCDFYYGSIVQRGALQIAISTNGESPALAQRLRKEIDAQLPQDTGEWLAQVGQLRREVIELEPAPNDERKFILHKLAQRETCEFETCPSRQMAREHAAEVARMAAPDTPGAPHLDSEMWDIEQSSTALAHVQSTGCPRLAPLGGEVWQQSSGHGFSRAEQNPDEGGALAPEVLQIKAHTEGAGLQPSHSLDQRTGALAPEGNARKGTVYLVGAGPGDPGLLTLKALRLLQSADLVLHDDLVPDSILALIHTGAIIDSVGKRCGRARITQQGINAMLVESAQNNLSVVRLKSGDPMVFGRAAEELDALRAANIPCEVVPGVSAVFAAAATLQTPLTDRRTSSRLILATGSHADGKQAPPLWHGALTDEATLAVYMPGRDFATTGADLLAHGMTPDMPVVAISRAGQPEQSIATARVSAMANLHPGPAPVLLLIGRALEPIVTGEKHLTPDDLLAMLR